MIPGPISPQTRAADAGQRSLRCAVAPVRGEAETYTEGGEEIGKRLNARFRFSPAWIRIRPRRIVALGIDGGPFELSARDVA